MGSWEKSGDWYSKIVGEEGHYYHKTLLLPALLKQLSLKPGMSLLDMGCGQGILARSLPKGIEYWGVDMAPSLIREAKKLSPPECHFFATDASKKLPFAKTDFDAAVFLLSLQNMEHAKESIHVAASLLKPQGKLILILNHPCFRIPRQSSWEIDEKQKIQYRRMNLYMSPQKIPIQTHPGKGETSETTHSFHYPLSTLVDFLAQNNCLIDAFDELCSNKKSEGGRAKMEDRARKEFPLFLMISAKKVAI